MSHSESIIYLVPSVIDDDALDTIPSYIINHVMRCQVIIAENERTTRRFLKALKKEIVINDFEWFTMHKAEEELVRKFRERVLAGKKIAIISEAGCPGIADPGQVLVNVAQEMNVTVQPLVGPSAILLSLMASGMNGQEFHFCGYLPIEVNERAKKLKELEAESAKSNCTKIFIETPYRNNQMLETILKTCNDNTRICIAAEITSGKEFIKTKSVVQWKMQKIDLHKKPVIFLLQA